MDNQQVEQTLAAHGKDAPRITAEHVNGKIVTEHYLYPEGTPLTICVLTLENGFHTIGTSSCASPENYVKEIGDSLAKKDAVQKIWVLEGYLLKQKLYEQLAF